MKRIIVAFFLVVLAYGAFACKKSARVTPAEPTVRIPETLVDPYAGYKEYGGFYYYLEEDVAVIVALKDRAATIAVFPDSLEGKPVTKMMTNALPETVTSVYLPKHPGEFTPDDFAPGVTFTIPYHETARGNPYTTNWGAYTYLSPALSSYEGQFRFIQSSDPYFSNLVIPYSVDGHNATYTLVDAFAHASALETVYAPWILWMEDNALTSDIFYTFNGATNIKSVSFPMSTNVAMYAFYKSKTIKNVSFPKAIAIGNWAFCNCDALEDVSFPSATLLGASALRECIALTNAHIPNLTNIRVCAFMQSANLQSADFPKAVSIEQSAFTLTKIKNAVFPLATSLGSQAFEGCVSLTNAEFLNLADSVNYCTFGGCHALKTVLFPKLTEIDQIAVFYSCSSIETISLPNVMLIHNTSFLGCTSLTNVEIGSALTNIHGRAFSGCVNLTTMTIRRATAPGVATNAFTDTPTNKTLYVPVNATGYDLWTNYGFTVVKSL